MLAVGVAGQAAAFEVERSGAPNEKAVSQPKSEVVSPGQVVKKKAASGTEVRIPGLGQIGVLPKLDFGLELLYGANKDSTTTAQSPDAKTEPEDGSFRIRGPIKHRF